MSESPGDLAVAFRSFGRRLDEAMAPTVADPKRAEAGSPSARELAGELGGVLSSAAGVMRAGGGTGDVRATGAALADAIAATPADAWDDARLDQLRSLALDGGRIIRQIEQAVARAQP